MPWNHDFDEYLQDESRRTGGADSISFPTSEAEAIEHVRDARARNLAITVQGARTGIVGGAVPEGGHVLNLSRMKSVGEVHEEAGEHLLTVQPGALLSEIREVASSKGLIFPPDPTETSASIGGMVACNASGALTFRYGPTRQWVNALRMVMADGSVLRFERGRNYATGRSFSLKTEDGRVVSGQLPLYSIPCVKSTAGYYVADDMDLIDLVIGSEGTLGVITEIDLLLAPKPAAFAGLTLFTPTEEAAVKLVHVLREGGVAAKPVAIEFFNSDSLDLIRRMKCESSAFADLPALRDNYDTALYTEFHGEDEESVEEAAMSAMEEAAELGVSDGDTWFATTDREMGPMKAFRHAVPEAVNLLIAERKRSSADLTKLGTDMSVPDDRLDEAIQMYNRGLREAGLESVIFGHISANHLHVNILPNSLAEYEKGKALYMAWARQIVSWEGSVSGEHGIGKIKAPFLGLMYGEDGIERMRELKRLFDPDFALNPGDLFQTR